MLEYIVCIFVYWFYEQFDSFVVVNIFSLDLLYFQIWILYVQRSAKSLMFLYNIVHLKDFYVFILIHLLLIFHEASGMGCCLGLQEYLAWLGVLVGWISRSISGTKCILEKKYIFLNSSYSYNRRRMDSATKVNVEMW